MKINLIYIFIFLICFITCSTNCTNKKQFCIDYPKAVVSFQVKSLGKISLFNKGDSIILFMNNYLSSKQSKVLKNTFAYIDISQKKIIGIDSFDIGDIEKTTSLEDVEYTVLTNDPNIIKIKSSHENWGRGGKQNSKIILINKNQEIVKMFLFPCFKNSSIKVLFSFKGYLIIGSKNIYDVNDSTNWLYVYKISDLISTNCNNYLSESIDFDEKIPDTIMKKYDPNLIGDIEF